MHEVEFFKERCPSIKTTVTCDTGVVAEYTNKIKGIPPKCLLVGLDTEWIELLSGKHKVALIVHRVVLPYLPGAPCWLQAS
jgi:hypothetical protein